MGYSGFDYVCIDTQHGQIDMSQMLPMLQGLAVTGTAALVRTRWNDEPAQIMRALDAGAQGVIVPMITSAEEAARAAGACRYPPAGYRSWGPTRVSLGQPGFNPTDANRDVVCCIMIETAAAYEHLDEIMSVPGIDVLYVGPSDLGLTSGTAFAMDASDPEQRRVIEDIYRRCRENGIVPGIHCGNIDSVLHWLEVGFQMLTVGSDYGLLRQKTKELLSAIHESGRLALPRH
jgi:4-hydroxy-2-oxoheptanedioate aldolase